MQTVSIVIGLGCALPFLLLALCAVISGVVKIVNGCKPEQTYCCEDCKMRNKLR